MWSAPLTALDFRTRIEKVTRTIVLDIAAMLSRPHVLMDKQVSLKIFDSSFWVLFYAITLGKSANKVLALIALSAATVFRSSMKVC